MDWVEIDGYASWYGTNINTLYHTVITALVITLTD